MAPRHILAKQHTHQTAASFLSTVTGGARFDLPASMAVVSVLASGAASVTCSVRDGSGNIVAVKKIPSAFESLEEANRGMREVKIMQRLRHSSVVVFLRAFAYSVDLYIVMECIPHTLRSALDTSPLTSARITSLFTQMLEGTAYIHASGLVHNDIKPSNLLVSELWEVKICDFGHAQRIGEVPARGGTLWYRAPESLHGIHPAACSSDMWAVGCVYYEMLHGGVVLFPGRDESDQRALISKYNCLYEHSNDFLQSLLELDPAKRVTARQALLHRDITGITGITSSVRVEPTAMGAADLEAYHTMEQAIQAISSIGGPDELAGRSRSLSIPDFIAKVRAVVSPMIY